MQKNKQKKRRVEVFYYKYTSKQNVASTQEISFFLSTEIQIHTPASICF